jgi:hypothetical protein
MTMQRMHVVLVRSFGGNGLKSCLRIWIEQGELESDQRYQQRVEEEIESLSDWTAVKVRCFRCRR